MWAVVAALLALGLFLFDFSNVLAWSRRHVIAVSDDEMDDFTLVLPVYGSPRYFGESHRRDLSRVRERCLVSMDVGSVAMEEFAEQLESEGWRVARSESSAPSAPVLVLAALPHVTTTYVVRLDADTQIGDGIARVVAAVARDDADVASVKCFVENERASLATRLQALEYRMSMLSRHYRAWQTSGACHVARTSAMRRIFERHSLWMPGEDLEVGRVANALKMRVRHVDYAVHTEAPATWRALYRQRTLWWAGNFRHVWINFDRNMLQMPAYTFYYVALVWCGVYFKWYEVWRTASSAVDALTLAIAVFAVYSVVTVLGNWQVRQPLMLAYPMYSIVQSLLMPVIGGVTYIRLARRKGRLGRYRFTIRREPVDRGSAAV